MKPKARQLILGLSLLLGAAVIPLAAQVAYVATPGLFQVDRSGAPGLVGSTIVAVVVLIILGFVTLVDGDDGPPWCIT